MRNIFLHSKTKLNIDSKQRVNIILSPQLYWVRIFELPLNSTKEVLEVLPSLFEEFVKDDKLSYYTVKIEDKKFLSFAYDEAKILNYIKQANLTLNQIVGVYFAQNEFASFVKNNQVCMRVDDVCLSFINDLLVQIPLMIKTDINNDLNIQNITLSKHKIYINSSSKYLDRKSAYILFGFLVVVSLFNFTKTIDNMIFNSNIPTQLENLKKQYNMPPTLIQTRSIIASLDKVRKKQQNIREFLSYVLETKKRFGARILNINLKNNKYTIKFTDAKPKKITTYLEKKYNLTSAVVKDNILTLKVEL